MLKQALHHVARVAIVHLLLCAALIVHATEFKLDMIGRDLLGLAAVGRRQTQHARRELGNGGHLFALQFGVGEGPNAHGHIDAVAHADRARAAVARRALHTRAYGRINIDQLVLVHVGHVGVVVMRRARRRRCIVRECESVV